MDLSAKVGLSVGLVWGSLSVDLSAKVVWCSTVDLSAKVVWCSAKM